MGGKSKRYFRHDRRSPSKSPERSKSHRSSSSASTSHSSHSKSRSPTRFHATVPIKYFDNKSASEKLKKSIQDKLKNVSKPTIDNISSSKSPKVFVSLDDQVKRSEAIDKINNSKFQSQSFSSSRNTISQQANKQNSIDLLNIPLPEDDNSWRDNPRLLIDSTLQMKTAKEREQKWSNNLLMLRNGLLKEVK